MNRKECDIRQTVLDLALPLVEAAGLELWGLEVIAGSRLRVSLFVDVPAGASVCADGATDALAEPLPASATIDQCESVSRQLGLALDVEDCIPQAWVLEVSSPGLERRFFSLEQMRPYVGDIVEARLSRFLDDAPAACAERKVFRGRLLEVSESSFELEPCGITDTGDILPENVPPCRIPWEAVRAVRRVHVFVAPRKPGHGNGRSRKRQPE